MCRAHWRKFHGEQRRRTCKVKLDRVNRSEKERDVRYQRIRCSLNMVRDANGEDRRQRVGQSAHHHGRLFRTLAWTGMDYRRIEWLYYNVNRTPQMHRRRACFHWHSILGYDVCTTPMTKPGRHALSMLPMGSSFSAADNLIEGSEDPELEQGGQSRRHRHHVLRNRYPGVWVFPALDRYLQL
jgi:hypothetical protein